MARFTRLKNLSPWRRIALVTWKKPREPSVYGQFDFDATRALAVVEKIRAESGQPVTLTHLITKVAALTLKKHPALNGIIKWGTIYKRDTIDVSLHVAVPREAAPLTDHLSATKICEADGKSIAEIASELQKSATNIRAGDDKIFKKTFNLASIIPVFLLRIFIWLHEFCIFNLSVNLPMLGFRPDPFGTVMITSVGSLGLPPGLAPLVPPSRCPFIICLGAVVKKPWVVADRIEIRPVAGISLTFDHRFMDGYMASRMFKTFVGMLEEPENIS